MQSVLVIGLGEIGGTIFSVLKESGKFDIYGIDLDKKKVEECGALEPLSQVKKSPANKLDVLDIASQCRAKTSLSTSQKATLKNISPNLQS